MTYQATHTISTLVTLLPIPEPYTLVDQLGILIAGMVAGLVLGIAIWLLWTTVVAGILAVSKIVFSSSSEQS